VADDQKNIALHQLANIVIDAYLDRDKQFVPEFAPGVQAKVYLRRREEDHPDLRTNVWYRRSDYEPLANPDEKKKPTT
jgi:hypothetical protein